MTLPSLSLAPVLALALTAAGATSALAATADTTNTAATPAVTAAAETETVAAAEGEAPAAPLEFMGVRIGNPIDPSTWWDGHGENASTEPLDINPMDPEFWVAFVDPDMHSRLHATFTNPATMGQFLKADTYTAMMDMGIMMKWMDLDSFAPLYDAQTYAYWMQPGAYTHMLNLENYSQMIDLANYTAVLDTAAETFGVSY